MHNRASALSLTSKSRPIRLHKIPDIGKTVDTQAGAAREIRIYREGLLVARCKALDIVPSGLIAVIDPLPYPVTTRLEIEFVSVDKGTGGYPRIPAIVTQRTTSGIELTTTADEQTFPAR